MSIISKVKNENSTDGHLAIKIMSLAVMLALNNIFIATILSTKMGDVIQ